MDKIEKILWWLDEAIKNVKHNKKDKRNTELVSAYYEGYNAALKEIKKKVITIEQE